jgi:adenine phosphoribosyltransferase
VGRKQQAVQNLRVPGGQVEELKKLIREIPDFPKPGILFYDITTLLKDPIGLHKAVDALANYYVGRKVDRVVGIEARGFIFAPMVAYRLNAGFVPVRKPKKLPAETARAAYDLEYGKDALEVHRDAITKGQQVLIIDDLLATGGTAAAVAGLVASLGGTVAGLGFLVELEFLKGRAKLGNYEIHSVVKY